MGAANGRDRRLRRWSARVDHASRVPGMVRKCRSTAETKGANVAHQAALSPELEMGDQQQGSCLISVFARLRNRCLNAGLRVTAKRDRRFAGGSSGLLFGDLVVHGGEHRFYGGAAENGRFLQPEPERVWVDETEIDCLTEQAFGLDAQTLPLFA
jgi:hypothetical protein